MKRKMVWMLVCILCLGLFEHVCMTVMPGAVRQVQAAEYVYPVEETKITAELDSEYKDAQGVRYTLDSETYTAEVGQTLVSGSEKNNSEYQGANNGVCVIPETVSFDGSEYTVTNIAPSAFYQNQYLATIVIADTVETIGALALNTSYMKYIYIGSGVQEIENAGNMLGGCRRLVDICVSSENTNFVSKDGILFSYDMKRLIHAPAWLDGRCLTTYEVPDGVELIGESAFSYSRFRRILLPDTVKTIEDYAFNESYITDIDLSSVTTIGRRILNSCWYLHTINYPDSDWLVDDAMGSMIGGIPNMRVMYLKKGLSYVRYNHEDYLSPCYLEVLAVQEGTTKIGKKEFYYDQFLRTVVLPDGLKTIEKDAFSYCTRLKKIYIPDTVTGIGDGVLSNTEAVVYGIPGSNAESYAAENGLQFVDASHHDHENLPETVLYEDAYSKMTANYCEECGYGKNVKQIFKEQTGVVDGTNGAYDFFLDKTREKVTLDENMMDSQGVVYEIISDKAYVKTIGSNVQTKHIVIPEVVICNNQEYIVSVMWGSVDNSSIESITLPDTLDQIYNDTFRSSLQYLYIGEGLRNHDSRALDIKGIKGIWVAPGNARYYVEDKVLYDKNGNVLCDFSGNIASPSPSTEPTPTVEPTPTQTPSTEPTPSETPSTDPAPTEQPSANPMPTEQPSTDPTPTQTPTEQPTPVVLKPGIVSDVKAATKNGKHIILSWNRANHCNKYEIYRATKKNGKYQCIGTVANNKNTYIDKNVEAYKTYYYKIRAVSKSAGKKMVGKYSKTTGYVVNGLKTPEIAVRKKKTSSGIRYLDVTMKNINGTNIELYVKKGNSKYVKVKLVSNRLSYYKGKMKIGYKSTGQKMWVRLRTYKTVKGKKYYSDYSKPVLIKS
ncbi:MAG: leucine-rich repeat protein [Wujia sp.]